MPTNEYLTHNKKLIIYSAKQLKLLNLTFDIYLALLTKSIDTILKFSLSRSVLSLQQSTDDES